MIDSIVTLISSPAILWMFGGLVLGLIFGAIPGLTATLAVVMLVPITYSMDSITGMATLIGVYVGGISGGLVSAIMLNMPGTPSSVATCWDGYPMALQGRAGKALGTAVMASCFGTIIGWICLVTMAPALSKIAISFGPYEYVAAILFGFTCVISLSGGSVFKGVISALFGLTLMTVGYDPFSGVLRATYGIKAISGGISYLPALVGLFVISEAFIQMENAFEKYVVPKQKLTNMYMTLSEFKASVVNILRSSAIGVAIGILPGIGASFSNFVAYDQAKKASKDPDSFGKGNLQGIIASEAANNGAIGGALIPMTAIGIPGDAVTAALLGGLMLKGINPGPLFIRENPDVLFSIYNSLLLSSFLMLIFMLTIGLRTFPTLLRLPKYLIVPIVLIMTVAGAYNIGYSIRDVWVMIIVGLIGYLFTKVSIPKVPMVIAMILSDNFEVYLRSGLAYFDGSLLPLFTRPYALLFIVLSVGALVAPVIKARLPKKVNNGNRLS